MATRYTEGPWEAVNNLVRSPMPEGCLVAEVPLPHESAAVDDMPMAYANARLIAAAPDMLDALDEAYDLLMTLADHGSPECDCDHCGITARIRAAVTKATRRPKGEQDELESTRRT